MTVNFSAAGHAAVQAAEQLTALRNALEQLDAGSREFAQSLLRQFSRRGRLTERQWPHVGRLIERAQQPRSTATAAALPAVGLAALTQRFRHATASGIRPLIRAGNLRIAAPAPRSRYAGQETMFVRHEGTYVGRIADGVFLPANGLPVEAVRPAVRDLVTLLDNPLERLAAIGRETGQCCYCGRELTDERSVSVGYGPICAGHYGLPWGDADAPVVEGIGGTFVEVTTIRDTARQFAPREPTVGEVIAAHRANRTHQSARPAAASNTVAVPPDQLDDEDRQFMGND